MTDRFGYGVLPGRGKAMRGISLSCVLTLAASGVLADPVTILAYGDSLTAGYGLPVTDGFVPQMQAWLDAQGAEVVLVNGGVSGDTTTGGLARIDWALTPDIEGIIVILGGNDYLRGIDPAVSAAALEGIVSAAQAADLGVLLVGIVAGANYGPDYQSTFNAMYSDLASTHDLPLVPDFFEGLRPARDAGTLRDYLQDDGIHPNAAGVALIVDNLGPAVLDLVASLAP